MEFEMKNKYRNISAVQPSDPICGATLSSVTLLLLSNSTVNVDIFRCELYALNTEHDAYCWLFIVANDKSVLKNRWFELLFTYSLVYPIIIIQVWTL